MIGALPHLTVVTSLMSCSSRGSQTVSLNSRPILVVMDNHATHLSKAIIDISQKDHTELLCLPAHSTHLLQPLDVGYYQLLKANISELSTSLGYTGMKTIPRNKFPKILQLGINKISGKSTSFAGVGICPFNDRKVKEGGT